jgi:hypothetical protein
LASLLSSTGSAIDDVPLSSTGTASGTTNQIPGGTTTVTAHYPGNGTLGGSDSAPVSVNVSPEPSTTTYTVLNPNGTPYTGGVFGTSVSQNVVVAGRSGFGIPTGGVSLSSNGVPQGIGSLNNTGTLSIGGGAFPQVGTYSLTANYLGDASFQPSATPSAINFTVTKASPTVTVQSSLSTVAPGAQVSLTAIIATTSQAGFPTGNVTFLSGSTTLATMMVGGLIQGGFQYGTALLVTSGLPTGTDSITVQYTGDSNFTGENSPAITVNVVPQPDFSVSASPSPVTVSSPGQSASTTLTIAGVNGFGGVTTFSCAGLPAKSACVFLPATVTGSGTTMLTVTTTAASGVAPGDRNSFNDWTAKSGAIRALVFSAALFILAMQIRRRRWNFAGALFVVALLLGTAACGGGGSTPPPVIPGTPVGTTTVTVSATSAAAGSNPALTHSTTFTLTVN